jgi:hypothetical protein
MAQGVAQSMREPVMDDSKSAAGRDASTLWVLGKGGGTMTCLLSGEAGHHQLQVLFGREVYLDEMHTVREGAIARARTLLHGFEAHGWAPVVVSPTLHD